MCSVANLKFTLHNIYGCDHHGDQGPAVSIPCSIDSLILCIYLCATLYSFQSCQEYLFRSISSVGISFVTTVESCAWKSFAQCGGTNAMSTATITWNGCNITQLHYTICKGMVSSCKKWLSSFSVLKMSWNFSAMSWYTLSQPFWADIWFQDWTIVYLHYTLLCFWICISMLMKGCLI